MEEDAASTTSHEDELVEDTPCFSAFHAGIAVHRRKALHLETLMGRSS